MILSAKALFCEDQAVTATAISENVLEFLDNGTVYGEAAAIARNLGAGNEIPLGLQVTEDFATLTSLTITLESDSVAGLSSSPTVHYSSGAIPAASLVAGYKMPIRWLPVGTIGKYLGFRFTVTGSNATAGKITAGLGTWMDAP